MAMNTNICQSAFTDTTTNNVRKIHIQELRNALSNLDNLKGNVQNCDCSPSNCCQSAPCQTCQVCQSCQTATCQSCQGGSNCTNCNCSSDCSSH